MISSRIPNEMKILRTTGTGAKFNFIMKYDEHNVRRTRNFQLCFRHDSLDYFKVTFIPPNEWDFLFGIIMSVTLRRRKYRLLEFLKIIVTLLGNRRIVFYSVFMIISFCLCGRVMIFRFATISCF